MESIIIKSIQGNDEVLGDLFEVTAELRAYPITSDGRLVKNTDGMSARKIEMKHFKAETTIYEIFTELKKEQDDFQKWFSELIDSAVALDMLIGSSS
ncbi:MAG: hypothetical protein RBR88_06845 [Candidatus Saccharicenans sp.]|jgi:hypothetical protein|nr:hypothetical protein [Candidatus Saccharicenans sp.]HNT01521.1 hypothetical protein [Candidatus Saccharicenans sp.]